MTNHTKPVLVCTTFGRQLCSIGLHFTAKGFHVLIHRNTCNSCHIQCSTLQIHPKNDRERFLKSLQPPATNRPRLAFPLLSPSIVVPGIQHVVSVSPLAAPNLYITLLLFFSGDPAPGVAHHDPHGHCFAPGGAIDGRQHIARTPETQIVITCLIMKRLIRSCLIIKCLIISCLMRFSIVTS